LHISGTATEPNYFFEKSIIFPYGTLASKPKNIIFCGVSIVVFSNYLTFWKNVHNNPSFSMPFLFVSRAVTKEFQKPKNNKKVLYPSYKCSLKIWDQSVL